jgi:hypothetical protein
MSSMRPGTNYNARMAAAERDATNREVLALAVLRKRAADCIADRHRTQTDDDTGDEICKLCGLVANEPERQIRDDR